MFFYFFLRGERAYKYGRPRGRDNFQILRPPPAPIEVHGRSDAS